MLKTHKLFQLLKELLLLGPKPLPALAELEVLFLQNHKSLTLRRIAANKTDPTVGAAV